MRYTLGLLKRNQAGILPRNTVKMKRRPVEVVVFEEPGKKARSDSRTSKTTSALQKKKIQEKKDTIDQEDFMSIFEDVKTLGVTGFSKKEKKRLEHEKLQSLGARKPKGQKVPYPILQQMIKTKQEKEKKHLEMEKAMGIFSKKKKETKNSKSRVSAGWWTDKPIQIEKASNNLKIKKADINAFKNKMKR